MKMLFILIMVILMVACSSTGNNQSYPYCQSNIPEPQWYVDDSLSGNYTAYVSTHYRAGIENEINQLVRVAIAQQIYTEVSSESTLIRDKNSSSFSFTYSTRSATNLMLPNTRIERHRSGSCIVAFGSISPERVEESIRRKEALDRMEREEWTKIHASMDIRDYVQHIQRYPDGRYRQQAERNTEYLRRNPPNAIAR